MKPEREIYFGWLTAMFAAGLGYLIEFLHKAITAYTDLSLWSPVSTSLPLYLSTATKNIPNTIIIVTVLARHCLFIE